MPTSCSGVAYFTGINPILDSIMKYEDITQEIIGCAYPPPACNAAQREAGGSLSPARSCPVRLAPLGSRAGLAVAGGAGIGKSKPSVPLEVKAEQDISFDLRILIVYHSKRNDSSKEI